MAGQSVRIGLVQMSASSERSANLERASNGIESAARQGAQIVCLPELFASQYFCRSEDAKNFDLAEPIPGPTTQAISSIARRLKVTVLCPVFERRAPGLYHNSVVLLGPDGAQAGLYRKMHIPDDPLYYEKFYFSPGDLGFVAVKTEAAILGPLICWDQWYPEAARLTALRGAQILFYPTAIGWLAQDRAALGAAQLDAWRTVQRAHAITNGVFVAAVNRVGSEGETGAGIEFWGHSFVCGPFGVVLAEAGEAEQVLLADCDLAELEQIRRGWPFFRDRRTDAYAGLTLRWLGED
ncbi:MAG TPA: carbon-nitrogen hydrolase [Polyangiaceae bacterium]